VDFVAEIERDRAAAETALLATEARIAEIAEALRREGLIVTGSKSQPVPNRLLGIERGLRRDSERLRDRLDALRIRLRDEQQRKESDEQLVRMNQMTQWRNER
jgi:hypothetical protein